MTRRQRPGLDPSVSRALWGSIAILGGILLASSVAGVLSGMSTFVIGIVPSALTMLVGIYGFARPNGSAGGPKADS